MLCQAQTPTDRHAFGARDQLGRALDRVALDTAAAQHVRPRRARYTGRELGEVGRELLDERAIQHAAGRRSFALEQRFHDALQQRGIPIHAHRQVQIRQPHTLTEQTRDEQQRIGVVLRVWVLDAHQAGLPMISTRSQCSRNHAENKQSSSFSRAQAVMIARRLLASLGSAAAAFVMSGLYVGAFLLSPFGLGRMLSRVSIPRMREHRLRSCLTALGIALGIAVLVAVILVSRSIVLGVTQTIADLAGKADLQARWPRV
jgi:hypothetical protein